MTSAGDDWALLAAHMPTLDWERLEAYVRELERWNRAIRLVGPRDLGGIRLQVTDSFLPFLVCPPQFPLLDIGSGAGLPGLVLALAFPPLPGVGGESGGSRVVCVEPQGKRASFLRHAVRHLALEGVEVVEQRAEVAVAARGEFRRAFRTVTARGVAGIEELLRLADPYLAEAGRVILPRGDESPMDLEGWRLVVDTAYEGPLGLGLRRVLAYERDS